MLDNGLSARYLLNEWMDFDQTCTAILLRQRQELIRFFVSLIPFSRLHKAMILENGLSAPYLIEEWMNFDRTCIKVYCDLEFIIDTIYFNNTSVQTCGGIYIFLRKDCSSFVFVFQNKTCHFR